MSWLFSQALVAEYSAETSLVGELSAPSSGNHIQRAFLSHGKTTGFSRLSRFGMMCKPLTEDRGAELLMSYLEAFRAKTSARQERVQESTEIAAECGSTWRESSVRYDLNTSSWKTHRCLWEEDLPWSSVILPKWGMTRNGHVYRHPTRERPIGGIVSGLWQTIVADDSMDRKVGKWNSRGEPKLSAQVLHPEYWPTPSAMIVDAKSSVVKLSGRTSKDPQVGLADKVMAVEARNWPTATATASKGWSPNHNRANSDDRLDYTVERESFLPGQPTPPMRLNPDWVEWLMGWPLGWTDLKPLATDRFREWQRQHSPCCLDDREAA